MKCVRPHLFRTQVFFKGVILKSDHVLYFEIANPGSLKLSKVYLIQVMYNCQGM